MTWSLDPHHTAVSFSAKHLGVATVRGRFDEATADLDLDDPNDPTTGKGTVTVKAASITTGSEQRDGHLKTGDFLEVEKYPDIVFKLTKVTRKGDQYEVVGDLTIKDVTKEITLDYEHSGVVIDPYGNTKVGGTLTGTLNRSDWGLTWNKALETGGFLVSDKVNINIEIALVRKAGD